MSTDATTPSGSTPTARARGTRESTAPHPAPEALERACDARDAFERAVNCPNCPGGDMAGIHWPADPDGFDPPEGWSWVERCDSCQRYADDESAAGQLIALGHGSVHGYFDRETLAPRATADGAGLTGCSVAIDTVA